MANPTLLIVDDEDNIVNSLARSLRDQFLIYTAGSGAAALEILAKQKIDLILTDERMPGMSGVELLAQANLVQPATIGIIITAYTDVSVLTTALNLGNVRGFIPKPWNIEKLRNQLLEALLKQGEHFIQQVLDTTPDGITIYDTVEKRNIYVNRSTEEILGYSFEQIKNMPDGILQHLTHPDQAALVAQHMNLLSAAPEDTLFVLQCRYQHGNGEWRLLTSWDRVLSRSADGQPRLVLGTLRDITQAWQIEESLRLAHDNLENTVLERTGQLRAEIEERSQAQEALRESESRYHAIVDNLPNGILHIFDRDFRYLFNAGEELRKLGLSNEMLVGKSIFDVLSPDLAVRAAENYTRVLEGESLKFEGEFGDQTFLVHAAPLHDKNGQINQILVLSINITERKRMEQDLRVSQETYKLMDEASQDMIYSYDLNGRFTHANTRLCKLLGLKVEQIVGKTHQELGFPEEQCVEWEKLHKQVIATRNTVISETITPIQSGSPQYFEVVLNPICDDAGAVIGIAGTTRDIHARKMAEVKINEQIAELRRWHAITMGREERILELKREVNELLIQSGKPTRYASVE